MARRTMASTIGAIGSGDPLPGELAPGRAMAAGTRTTTSGTRDGVVARVGAAHGPPPLAVMKVMIGRTATGQIAEMILVPKIEARNAIDAATYRSLG